ncbi:MAG: hypothetical protein H0W25_17855 [Acidimicrobiia bacterium]|nr:hypothetical protein [Acidimicrobiia bacterium]
MPIDKEYLAERDIAHEVHEESSMTCVVIRSWQLPTGLDRPEADVLVRLPAGYPDIAPDMWWVEPALRTATGQVIPATEATEVHLGRTWQRWSRHFAAGQWQPGVDRLESYLALIRGEFQRAAGGHAA